MKALAACVVVAAGALALGLTQYSGVTLSARTSASAVPAPSSIGIAVAPAATSAPASALGLTPELRQKGFHECMIPDPGLGPYAAPRQIALGAFLYAPQKAGHTDDFGYDVVVHFHGQLAARKMLLPVARGVVFVGLDLGIGSGAYEEQFLPHGIWETLRGSIERGLRKHAGDERAHVRHLALTSWSAGYGATNAILRGGDEGIDAVVMLDGLHAGFLPGANKTQRLENVDGRGLDATLRFARRATLGEKYFLLTHSQIDPVKYPSSTLTADWLLRELGVPREPVVADATELRPLRTQADKGNFHLRGFAGQEEMAHCEQESYLVWAVRDVLEPAWDTPAADHSVTPVNVPKAPIPMKE